MKRYTLFAEGNGPAELREWPDGAYVLATDCDERIAALTAELAEANRVANQNGLIALESVRNRDQRIAALEAALGSIRQYVRITADAAIGKW